VASRHPEKEFIVSVAPIKKQIRAVKAKLLDIEATDAITRKKVSKELRILKKVWYDLGNLTF
jgi:hypothetical protein